MSAWRRRALLGFPERRLDITSAASFYQWIFALGGDLRAFYSGRRQEPGLPRRVFAFAAWCFAAKQNPWLRNAIAVGFYEHLPDCAEGRRDLITYLPVEWLQELDSLFRMMHKPEAYQALQAEYQRVHGEPLRLAAPTTGP